jgi:hypothetical protein
MLANYITQGLDSEIKGQAGFADLTEYMAQDENAAGQKKCIAVALNNLDSVDSAARQLYAVAAKNTRVTEPVLHLVVSWPEFERPSDQDIFWAGRRVLKALNLQEHQSIMAIHGDTDNIHVHIEVNRVHPITFRAQPLPWLHKTLHREARYIEIEKDWFHDNGLFVVQQTADGQKFVVPNDGFIDSPEIVHGNREAGADGTRGAIAYRVDAPASETPPQMDHWSDEPSLITLCRNVVAEEILAAIDVDPTWDAMHQVLASHGMQLRKSGASSWQLDAMKDEDGEVVRLPASKALRKVQLGKLSELLGDYSPAAGPLRPAPALQADPPAGAGTETAPPAKPGARPQKRDPEKRLIRKLERAQERTELIERYRVAKAAAAASRAALREEGKRITAWRDDQVKALRADFAPRRAAIQGNQHLTDLMKRQQYSLLAMERIQARLRIDATTKERREALSASLPPIPVWRPWVEELAKSGDEAAIKALRGMVYQERRETNKAARADVDARDTPPTDKEIDALLKKILAEHRNEDAIHPARRLAQSQAQVLLKMIEGMAWTITNNGSIRYSKAQGDQLFTDRGNRLTFDRRRVTDDELRLTLMHAREKFGSSIVLTGTDKIFTERMVKAAAEVGLQVRNPDLRALWQQHASKAQSESKNTPRRARTR